MHDKFTVTVAKSAGFCPGVTKAIDCVLELSEKGAPTIYTIGPLIHNKQVIASLEAKRIYAINNLDEIKDKNAVLVIRAHGVTPEFEKEIRGKGLKVVDATCPLVKNVHSVIEKYAAQGYDTVIVGDKDHAEVIGLFGYTGKKGHVVETVEEAKKLPRFSKVNIVSQTTQSEENFSEIAKIINANSDTCVISNTICTPTKNRQKETIELSKAADLMIIVGGKHSANTARLAELCSHLCPNTLHIETEDELNAQNLALAGNIVVTAGASTPSWATERVVNKINKIKTEENAKASFTLADLWTLFVNAYFFSAFSAAALTYAVLKLLAVPISASLIALPFLFILSLNIINRAFEQGTGTSDKYKALLFERYRTLLLVIGVISGVAAIINAYLLGPLIFMLTTVIWLAGVLYPVRNKLTTPARFVLGSKDIVTAAGWTYICAFVPLLKTSDFSVLAALTLIYVFLCTFSRAVMLGISGVHIDLIVGKENIYKALGRHRTFAMLWACNILTASVPLYIIFEKLNIPFAAALFAAQAYALMCLTLYTKKPPRNILSETLVNGQFFVLGLAIYFASAL